MKLEVSPNIIRIGKATLKIQAKHRNLPIDAKLHIEGCGITQTHDIPKQGAAIEINTKFPGLLMLIATNPRYGSAYAEITVVASFEDFKRDCLSDNEVTCDWNTLRKYLLDNTVSNNWWKLTKQQRISIIKAILKNTFPQYIPYYCKGKPNCEGCETDYQRAVCHENAIFRILRLGRSLGDDDKLYYNTTQNHETDICCNLEHYNLPVYDVTSCAMHAIVAIQVDEDPDDPNSWHFFQYGNFDIKPGDWQLPLMEPIGTIKIYKVKNMSVDYIPYLDTELYKYFVYDTDGTIRKPKKVKIRIEATPKPLYVYLTGTVEEQNGVYKCERDEGIYGLCVNWQTGKYLCKAVVISETCIAEMTGFGQTKVYGKTAQFTDGERVVTITLEEKQHAILTISLSANEAYINDTITIEGYLLESATEQPISDAEITLIKDNEEIATTKTDETGYYSFSYKITEEDFPYITLKTKFKGNEDYFSAESEEKPIRIAKPCEETCELSCQQTCELSCQSTCELSCQQTCELTSQVTKTINLRIQSLVGYGLKDESKWVEECAQCSICDECPNITSAECKNQQIRLCVRIKNTSGAPADVSCRYTLYKGVAQHYKSSTRTETLSPGQTKQFFTHIIYLDEYACKDYRAVIEAWIETCKTTCETTCEKTCQQTCEQTCETVCETECQETCELTTQVYEARCPLTILFIGTPLITYIQPLRKIKPFLPPLIIQFYYSDFLCSLARRIRTLINKLKK